MDDLEHEASLNYVARLCLYPPKQTEEPRDREEPCRAKLKHRTRSVWYVRDYRFSLRKMSLLEWCVCPRKPGDPAEGHTP